MPHDPPTSSSFIWSPGEHVGSANNEDHIVTVFKVHLTNNSVLILFLHRSVFCVTNCKNNFTHYLLSVCTEHQCINIWKHNSQSLVSPTTIICHFLLPLCCACGHLAEWDRLIW
jgi:hypothetical protein